MIRIFILALGASAGAIACGSRAESSATKPKCLLDSASLGRTAGAGLERAGLSAPAREADLQVTQRAIQVPGAERLLVTVSWGGPSNGALLWAECSGAIVDGEAAGYVLAVEPIAVGSGRTLIQPRAITGTGSGWKPESIHLYAVRPDDLALAWSGVAAERSHQAAAVGAYEGQGELAYVGADSLVHAATRVPISMSEDGSWRRDETRARRTVTTYRWNPDTRTYEPGAQNAGT